VEQTPGLNITKDAIVPGGTANAAGEVIGYTIAVQNTGNQTLTGVIVSDPFISDLTLVDSEATADGELDVGETWSYTATHVVLQSEIDAGGDIVNLATADSDQTGPDTDGASIPVEQTPSLNITKDAIVPGGTANAAGEVVSYTIAVQNTGNQTLTGVIVSDPFISDLTWSTVRPRPTANSMWVRPGATPRPTLCCKARSMRGVTSSTWPRLIRTRPGRTPTERASLWSKPLA
jgi:uncharacterized repeat protein (TIGR01451 family)